MQQRVLLLVLGPLGHVTLEHDGNVLGRVVLELLDAILDLALLHLLLAHRDCHRSAIEVILADFPLAFVRSAVVDLVDLGGRRPRRADSCRFELGLAFDFFLGRLRRRHVVPLPHLLAEALPRGGQQRLGLFLRRLRHNRLLLCCAGALLELPLSVSETDKLLELAGPCLLERRIGELLLQVSSRLGQHLVLCGQRLDLALQVVDLRGRVEKLLLQVRLELRLRRVELPILLLQLAHVQRFGRDARLDWDRECAARLERRAV
mmetsp:Transcript_24809/g.66621  ORF Transcript_24809/g.66621 Transcript_24809/m.66621 type:complete len:262 (+) Transcript_24809:1562-2347(+)